MTLCVKSMCSRGRLGSNKHLIEPLLCEKPPPPHLEKPAGAAATQLICGIRNHLLDMAQLGDYEEGNNKIKQAKDVPCRTWYENYNYK